MTDVIVIGAGLAGLACARDLAAGGADVTVLEARDRIGGRTGRGRAAGVEQDIGGELIGRMMTPIIGLVGELGIELEPSYADLAGETPGCAAARARSAGWTRSSARQRRSAHRDVYARMAEASAGLDPAAPWTHADAARIDALRLRATCASSAATR